VAVAATIPDPGAPGAPGEPTVTGERRRHGFIRITVLASSMRTAIARAGDWLVVADARWRPLAASVGGVP
jgi:hypothetical protein